MRKGARHQELTKVVRRRVSEIHAALIVTRAFSACGIHGREPDPREMPRIVARIESSMSLFVNARDLESVRAQLAMMLPAANRDPGAEQIDVMEEGDIVTARTRARELCVALGADRLSTQKAATIVSELARNIVSFTPGGYVELVPRREPKGIRIRAVDQGTGIANLSDVLSGNYRSRTGMGMGLLGTKRAANGFKIKTDSDGTRIEVDIVF